MNGKQLKNSILQWAIQGKLVPQDPNDEPASVLLEQIRAEKARLVKEKKIKKDKNESIIFRGDDNSHYEKFSDGTVKCIDDEIPFEIPESWEWCRLSSVTIYLHRGKSPKYGEAKLLPIIAQKCNQWDKIYTDRCLFSDQESISKYNEEHYLKIGDVIINSTGGGTVGRTGYVDDYVFFLYKNFVADSHVTVVRCSNKMNSKYLYYYLLSPYIQIGLEDKCSGSTNQIELGTNTIANYLLPVPPVDEQIRIVEKIVTSSPLVENYALSQEKLEELNKRLFINLKKSILQEAIQGKLVPQLAEEGDASELLKQIELEKQKLVKEGKLKKKDLVSSTIFRGDDNRYYEKVNGKIECIEEEIPFEIPESWRWVRLKTIFNIWSARRVHEKDWRKTGIPFYRAREVGTLAEKGKVDNDLFIEEQLYDEFAVSGLPHRGDLLVTAVGTLGKVYVVPNDEKFYFKDGSVLCLQNCGNMNPMFLKMAIESNAFKNQYEKESQGTTVATLTIIRVKEYLLPIPPRKEQDRIVNKMHAIINSL